MARFDFAARTRFSARCRVTVESPSKPDLPARSIASDGGTAALFEPRLVANAGAETAGEGVSDFSTRLTVALTWSTSNGFVM